MASLISASASLCSTSASSRPSLYQQSHSSISCNKNLKFEGCSRITHLGFGTFSQWSGLKHMGLPIKQKSLTKGKKEICKGRAVVRASLFGVGAPEALVIGVVALLVFGPKGLAEVARNLGKTLRAFQPTIRELQEVSREFKSSLEREIGLDEVSSQSQNIYNPNRTSARSTSSSVGNSENPPTTAADPNGAQSQPRAYTSEDYLKITEEQLKAAGAAEQQEQTPSPSTQSRSESRSEPQAAVEETSGVTSPPQKPENQV